MAQYNATAQAAAPAYYASTRYPDLEMAVEGNCVTFTYWETCEVFLLEGGQARLMASSDVAYLKPEVHEHVRELLGHLVGGVRQAELLAA